MLDHLLDPDDYPECPECGAELEVEGDKYEGSAKCCECEYKREWENFP